MRLLLLDQFSELGGAQRMLLDLLPAICSRGWDAVLAAPGDGPLCSQARAFGCEVPPLDCGAYGSGRKSAADMGRFLAKLPRLALQLRKLAERVRPDLVYINGPRLLPAAALARLPQPVLFHAHIEVSQWAARVLAGRSLARLNARVIAVCRGVADAWRPFAVVTVVYNGVAHPDRSLTVVAREGVPLIGCIGRIAPEKGQLEFVE